MHPQLIKFGIIGCGRIAPRHAIAIVENPYCTLKAVADLVLFRAENFSREYGAIPYSDYRKLLSDKSIDVICVCTPSGLHSMMAVEAMEAGKHVIVEKPMALSLQDAEKMIAASKRAERKLCIVFQNRFNPPILELKDAIDRKLLGKLLLCNATVRWYRPQNYYDDGWHGTLIMDGGTLLNQAIHYVDIIQWLMGNVKSVFSYAGTMAHQIEIEDTCVAVMNFKNRALGSIEASTITYPANLEGSISIFGEYGSVKIGGVALNEKVIWKLPEESTEHQGNPFQTLQNNIYGEGHKKTIANMVNSLMHGASLVVDGEEGKKSLIIIDAIYKSISSGLPISVSGNNQS
jgi:predicted dehydrogenase